MSGTNRSLAVAAPGVLYTITGEGRVERDLSVY